jgi:hypothetical protein
MLMYSGATLLCFLTDLLMFAVQYRWYAEGTSDFSNLWMMVVTVGYFFFDVLYLVWILSFQRKMPAYLNRWLLDSVVGDSEKLKREIYQNFDEGV